MKLLFAANTPDSRVTGIAKIMNSLRDELVRKGHQVDALFAEDVLKLRFPRRLSDFIFPFAVFFAIKSLWKAGKKPDLVALHSLAGHFYVFLRRHFKSLPPCVIVSYGSDEMRWNLEKEEGKLGLKKIRPFSKIFYPVFVIAPVRYATRHADQVMVAARSEISFYQKNYGINPSRVSFIPNGVSPDYFIKRNYSQNPKKILYLGGWEWRKGIRYLAASFSKLSEKYPDLKLTLAGIGASETEAKSVFSKKSQEQITVIPRLNPAETISNYASHDLFVFPSLFESMSLVVPEAMATGMPVITTQTCGMQDIVKHEDTGLLVLPRDSEGLTQQIERCLIHPDFAEKLGRAAQESARELSWDRIADLTLKMYGQLLSKNS